MIFRLASVGLLLALAACASVPSPTSADVLAIEQELAAEQAAGLTPTQALEYGALSVNRACDAWLEASASRLSEPRCTQPRGGEP